jgi:hypothetical protein
MAFPDTWDFPAGLDARNYLRSPQIIGCIGFQPRRAEKPLTCGATAACAVLEYLGQSATVEQCQQVMASSPVAGATFVEMRYLLRRRNLRAIPWCRFSGQEAVLHCSRSKPLLVEVPDFMGHWIVCIGAIPAEKAEESVLLFSDPVGPKPWLACTVKAWDALWGNALCTTTRMPPASVVTADNWARGDGTRTKVTDAERTMTYFAALEDFRTHRAWNIALEMEGKGRAAA